MYKRKTIYKYNLTPLIALALTIGIILGVLIRPKQQQTFLSPLADDQAIIKMCVVAPDPANPTQEQVIHMIVDEFIGLGTDITIQALKIANCESGFRYDAINYNIGGSTDGGVFQINSIHKQTDYIRFTARQNIRWAKNKYQRDGSWNAWACERKL